MWVIIEHDSTLEDDIDENYSYSISRVIGPFSSEFEADEARMNISNRWYWYSVHEVSM